MEGEEADLLVGGTRGLLATATASLLVVGSVVYHKGATGALRPIVICVVFITVIYVIVANLLKQMVNIGVGNLIRTV